jgi:ferredoxin
MSRFKADNDKGRCVACGVCVKTCPRDAVAIYHGAYAVVDKNLCVGCGLCVKACPAGVMNRINV